MSGIVSYGVYLPYWRLQRSAISQALGSGGGKGTRSVASHDEDTTSLGAEAARIALACAPEGYSPSTLYFATTSPAYADKTNANGIHAALAMKGDVPALDAGGAVRSGYGVARAAYHSNGLAVMSDVRTGLPGGSDEANGGDGAAAFCFGTENVICEPVAVASATAEFIDRWRVPGESYSKVWEERFGEHAYVPLAEQAATDVLKAGEIAIGDIDHVIVTGAAARAVGVIRKALGATPDATTDDLTSQIGHTGTAHWGVVLADVLDRARPGQHILVLNMADGADAILWRVTSAITDYQRGPTVRAQIASSNDTLGYQQFLTWRGFLQREPPRRPEPDRPASPPSMRTNAWKYGFFGSKDEGGFVHMPPSRVSMGSGAIDQMEPIRMADTRATIATFTIDRLAYSMSPPVVAVVIDFDGGGRLQCELTDVDPATVKIGDRVEMTFRRLYTQDGIHNYFWKARPVRGEN